MSNKSHDHVHRLIRSMSRAEKRYFKMHLSRPGQEADSVQGQLFDAIGNMERYDEAELLDGFRDASFIGHFAITKRRLYESILRSLESFHADSSATAKLNRVLHQVEILHQRALYEDAWKALQSARRLALTHQLLLGSAAVIEWERRLIECRNYADDDEASMSGSRERSSALLNSLAQVDELWHLKSTLFMHLYRSGASRISSTETAAIEELLDSRPIRADKPSDSSRARFLRLHIRSAAYFALGRLGECRDTLKENMRLLEGNKPHFIDEPNLMLGVVSNLAYVCARSGHHAEARDLLKRFRALPAEWRMPETEDLELKIFTTTTSLELGMHLRLGEVEEALLLIPVLERGLRAHERRIGPVRRASLRYLMAYTFFTAGDHDRSLRCVNDLLNGLRQDDHGDTARFGRLLQLLLFLECGKKDLLRYALRNAERFLRKEHGASGIESRVLKTIKSLSMEKDTDAAHDLLRGFITDAKALLSMPSERAVLDHLDPVAWAESKLSGKPFAKVARERALALGQAA